MQETVKKLKFKDKGFVIHAPKALEKDFLTLGFTAFLLLCLAFSCSNHQEAKTSNAFADKLIDFMIENKENQSVEMDNLYPATIDSIPEDQDEKLVLAEKLKAKGFKVIQAGRGNYPPLGARIVSLTLQKDDCECEVSKIYYLTTFESTYIRKERINCKHTP